jgi:ankyrin repeat protein
MKKTVQLFIPLVLTFSIFCNSEKSMASRIYKEPAEQLYEATRDGDIKKVKSLIADGVDVNSRDWNGGTPLHLAVSHGGPDLVELLLDHGADINATDKYG